MGNRISNYDTAAPSVGVIDSQIRVNERDARQTIPKLLKILEASAERFGGTFAENSAVSSSGQSLIQTLRFNFPGAPSASDFANQSEALIQANAFFTIAENPVRSDGVFGSLQMTNTPDNGLFSSIITPLMIFDDNFGLRVSDFNDTIHSNVQIRATGKINLGIEGTSGKLEYTDEGGVRVTATNGGVFSVNDGDAGLLIETEPGADFLVQTLPETTSGASNIGAQGDVQFSSVGHIYMYGGDTTKELSNGGDLIIESGSATPISPGDGKNFQVEAASSTISIIPPTPKSSNDYCRSGDVIIDLSNGGLLFFGGPTGQQQWPSIVGTVGQSIRVQSVVGGDVVLEWG